MADYIYSLHGANLIVEYPERIGWVQHAGWGTRVYQTGLYRDEDPPPDSSWNWFHLAPTQPLDLREDEDVFLREVRLHAELIDVRVDAVHLRAGGAHIWSLDESNLPIRDMGKEAFSGWTEFPAWNYGPCLAFRVHFETDTESRLIVRGSTWLYGSSL